MTDATVVRLDAASGSRIDLAELWRYRHLALLLAWRDIRVRYHQTAIGIGWAILQPCATMVFFSLFFGRLAKLPSDGLPYPVFYYSGLLPWMYFSHAVTNATNVLHEQARIISRVYFPRMVMPLAPVLAGLVDLAVAFTVLVALMAWSGLRPAGSSFLAPLFLGLGVLTASAVSLWLSALNSRFRDVKYALTFGLQLWMYASPVVYPMTLVPARWRLLYALNPLAVMIQGFRWSLTGHGFPGALPIVVTTIGVALVWSGGVVFFRHMEGTMADRL